MMKPKPIKTEKDYNQALKRLVQIFDAEPNSEDGEELEILANFIEEYENKHFPISL